MSRLGEYLLTQQERQAGSERFADEDLADNDIEDAGLEAQGLEQSPENWPAHRLPQQELPTTAARVAPREVQTALNSSVAPSRVAAPQFDPIADLAEVDEDVDSLPPGPIQYTKLLARTSESLDHATATDSENIADAESSTDRIVDLEPVYSDVEDLSPSLSNATALEFLRRRWADVCLALSAGILAISLVWAFWPLSGSRQARRNWTARTLPVRAAPGRSGACRSPTSDDGVCGNAQCTSLGRYAHGSLLLQRVR